MDYREMYFELFRRQARAIEVLESLADDLKLGHNVTEEMVIAVKDEEECETNVEV